MIIANLMNATLLQGESWEDNKVMTIVELLQGEGAKPKVSYHLSILSYECHLDTLESWGTSQ